MSKPTFERFNYSLRPAKNIERKMLCEVFARLPRIAPLSTYRYVGFGSNTFVDFSLFHQRLGITDMISIENRVAHRKRFEFNKPYSCIKMEWGDSNRVLSQLKWKKRCIVWLDYEGHLSPTNLSDISFAIKNLRSGSMLIITIPADSGVDEQTIDETILQKRMDKIVQRLGKDRIPIEINLTDLRGWGCGNLYRKIIQNEIADAINTRNGTIESKAQISYEQLFNFQYADGTKMITVGGLLVNPSDKDKLTFKHFKDLEFVCTCDTPYPIDAPVLTWREVRYLNERLPRVHPDVRHPNWLPEDDRKNFAKVYRYYPSYTEVEM